MKKNSGLIKKRSTATMQPAETTSDYRHKDLGLVTVNVFGVVFHGSFLCFIELFAVGGKQLLTYHRLWTSPHIFHCLTLNYDLRP